jgi:hypothetical protein
MRRRRGRGGGGGRGVVKACHSGHDAVIDAGQIGRGDDTAAMILYIYIYI